MNRFPVVSSDLRSVGYDPETHILEIEFRSGGVYRYSGVPEAVYSGLLTAGSKGRYFHARIKDHFSFVRVR